MEEAERESYFMNVYPGFFGIENDEVKRMVERIIDVLEKHLNRANFKYLK